MSSNLLGPDENLRFEKHGVWYALTGRANARAWVSMRITGSSNGGWSAFYEDNGYNVRAGEIPDGLEMPGPGSIGGFLVRSPERLMDWAVRARILTREEADGMLLRYTLLLSEGG